jgi:hypothetical protein
MNRALFRKATHDGPPTRRRAVVLVAALVCVGVALALTTELLRHTLQTRLALRKELLVRQTDGLAEAGLVRAARRLASDPAYAGETWRLDAAAGLPAGAAEIHIEVAPAEDAATASSLRVVARYPLELADCVQRSRTVLVRPRASQEEVSLP